MAKKGSITTAIDELPYIVKLLLCLPVVNIVWALYRLIKGIETSNSLLIVVGIIWILLGFWILWLVDFISVLIYGKPVVLVN